jgi:hypothetical protein
VQDLVVLGGRAGILYLADAGALWASLISAVFFLRRSRSA